MPVFSKVSLFRVSIALVTLVLSTLALADTPIIKPGAPGQSATELSADEAIRIADTSYSPADVQFMTDMIPHHHQALQMAELVGDRTNTQELLDIAGRIDVSQADEIEFMQGWLRDRGESVPNPTVHSARKAVDNSPQVEAILSTMHPEVFALHQPRVTNLMAEYV